MVVLVLWEELEMAAIDELLEHYRKRHDQILADVKVWRDNGYKLHHNNQDITESWLSDQEKRAKSLADVIAKYEKKPP
jgi:hypothetical protein